MHLCRFLCSQRQGRAYMVLLTIPGLRKSMRLSKDQSRKRWRELRDAVNDWDPVGLIEIGAPEDEYECLVGPLMRMLEAGCSREEIADYLNQHVPDHFGASKIEGAERFAEGKVSWFSESWQGTTV